MIRPALAIVVVMVVAGCASHEAHTGPPASHSRMKESRAMNRLAWMIGLWEGEGFLRSGGALISPVRTEWEVREAFGGRYIEMAFTHHLPSGETDDWVGYFTWDTPAGQYATIWVNVGNGYQFRERGTLDDAGTVLTLDSTHAGEGGASIAMRSVFTRMDADAFRVEDTMSPPGAEPVVTFSFSLTRR